MDTKIIAVVGATGAQGGGLVQAILADPTKEFRARVLTRNAQSEKARALEGPAQAGGVVHVAFCVTFFWDHFSPEKEQAQARAMAQAAKEAGLKHVVWSTLEDTRKWVPLEDPRMPTLQGRYKVPHFDAKGESDAFFTGLGVPTTFLLTSFYWDNLIHFGMGPKKAPDGKLAFVLPMADQKLPGIAAGDIGACALGIFKRGPELVGKTVGIAGEHLRGAQMAAALTRALGQEVVYSYVPPEVYRTFGFPGADDLANMFQVNRDFATEFCGARDLAFARSLHPGLLTFDQWLVVNKGRIPLA